MLLPGLVAWLVLILVARFVSALVDARDLTVVSVPIVVANREAKLLLVKYGHLLDGNWSSVIERWLRIHEIPLVNDDLDRVMGHIRSSLVKLGFHEDVISGRPLQEVEMEQQQMSSDDPLYAYKASSMLRRVATKVAFEKWNMEQGATSDLTALPTPRIKNKNRDRLLFTSRRENGYSASSNPLDDVKFILREFETNAISGSDGNHSDKHGSHDRQEREDYVPWHTKSVIPEFIRHRENHSRGHKLIVYQTRGVYTGGTVALQLLADRLSALGYDTLLCEEHNRQSPECANRQSSVRDVAVTGEWCHEVIEDYLGQDQDGLGENATARKEGATEDSFIRHLRADTSRDRPSLFMGRGVQYQLGFHHHSDQCRGHVTVTDSHYLQVLLGERILGAYYLGCAMTERFKRSHYELLRRHASTNSSGTVEATDPTSAPATATATATAAGSSSAAAPVAPAAVVKEDLIVVDPDLETDYPPSYATAVVSPPGYRAVHARGLTGDQMKLLLMRAKIVLDLAMPGPERLSGEGVLSGAVPVISSRWNGASDVDFPGIQRVDHQNSSQISEVLADIATNYEQKLQEHGNGRFFSYILSMWRRIHHTADVFFGTLNIVSLFSRHDPSIQASLILSPHVCPILLFPSRVLLFAHHSARL
jgi:hypothetical protein